MADNEEDDKQKVEPNPLDLNSQAKASIMIIFAAMHKSTQDAQQYLAMILRKTMEGKDKHQEAEDVMKLAETMLEAAMKADAGRGKIAIAALCLAEVIIQDLFDSLFPEVKKPTKQ